MEDKSSKVHDETRNIFRNHKSLNTSRKGEIIASELHELRKYRNMVDYDAENPKNIKFAYNYCKSRAKIVLNLLEELSLFSAPSDFIPTNEAKTYAMHSSTQFMHVI